MRYAYLIVTLCFAFSSCSESSKILHKSDYGDSWPFSVEEGQVECIEGFAVVFHSGNQTYALNEAARMNKQFGNIRDILRPDANYPGKKIMMDLSRIEFEGLKLCER